MYDELVNGLQTELALIFLCGVRLVAHEDGSQVQVHGTHHVLLAGRAGVLVCAVDSQLCEREHAAVEVVFLYLGVEEEAESRQQQYHLEWVRDSVTHRLGRKSGLK